MIYRLHQAMQTTDRPNVAFFTQASPETEYATRTTERGTVVVQGLRVFRAGSFKDSKGEEHTWEVADLDKMVDNFGALRSKNILPNVPVRIDHTFSAQNLIGYIVSLYRQEQFLVSDIEFTEAEGLSKFQRGTFRSRSLEIANYETNGGESFWPTVIGLAFVDLPAVEGLYSRPESTTDKILFYKESEVTEAAKEDPKVTLHTFKIGGADTQDVGAVQQHIAALEKEKRFTFKLHGQDSTDFEAVQRHIIALETAAREQTDTNRMDFVKKLVEDNKLGAPQKESTEAFVKGLSPDQYGAWMKTWETAPKLSLVQPHAGGVTDPNNQGGTDDKPSDLETAKAIVAQHRLAGMPEDKIKETQSYRTMVSLETKSA